MRVMVVDDSSTMRRIVINVVMQIGIEKENIGEAEDGKIALKKLQQENYDIILSDINMPNMNGFELIENIRRGNRGNHKTTPIVMITTEGSKQEVLRALKIGCNQYIVKPFNRETLKSKLKPFIDKMK